MKPIVRTVVMALLIGVLMTFVGLRSGADQKAFDHGAIYLTAGITAAYVVVSLVLMRRRKPGRGDIFFIRFGGILLILVGLGALYFMTNVSATVEMVQ